MHGRRSGLKILMLAVMLLLSCRIMAGSPTQLLSIQFQPNSDKTRIIFTMDKKTSGQVKYKSDPDRVIIIFENTVKKIKISNARLGSANIEKIDSQNTPEGGVEFVFTTRGKATWRTGFLKNDAAGNTVFQLDIMSAKPKSTSQLKKGIEDDLLSLLQEKKYTIGRARLDKQKIAIKNRTPEVLVVGIDAGHGGKDPGAIGANGVYEKVIALSIAKKLANEINQTKHMRAVLTRSGDYYVPLRSRLKLARKGNVDVFVAIHADAYYKTDTMGMSVYALSQRGATSEAARWLAERDNTSELDGIALKSLPDQSKMVRSVLIDLSQTATIQASLKLGNLMLDALDDISSLHYAQVEQAPFVVLKSPDIPSILVETGFISNPIEARRLANDDYQDEIAHALFVGLDRYAKKYHKS